MDGKLEARVYLSTQISYWYKLTLFSFRSANKALWLGADTFLEVVNSSQIYKHRVYINGSSSFIIMNVQQSKMSCREDVEQHWVAVFMFHGDKTPHCGTHLYYLLVCRSSMGTHQKSTAIMQQSCPSQWALNSDSFDTCKSSTEGRRREESLLGYSVKQRFKWKI